MWKVVTSLLDKIATRDGPEVAKIVEAGANAIANADAPGTGQLNRRSHLTILSRAINRTTLRWAMGRRLWAVLRTALKSVCIGDSGET